MGSHDHAFILNATCLKLIFSSKMYTRINIFNVFMLFSFFVIVLSTNGESTITSIPCNNNTDCIPYEVPENETNYECVDNFCKYNLNVEEALEIVTVVGAKCRFHVECNIENAMCINHICTCTTVASHDRKRCLNRIEIGGECEEDLQCSSTQSICDQNVCKCKHGFIVDSSDANNTLCRQPNGIGFKCNTKTDCEVANSTCSDKQVCKCKIGFVVYEKNCWENSFTMLSPCRVDVQCHTNLGPDSQCQEGFCHCKSTYNFDKLHNYCVSPDVKGIVSKGIEMSSDRLHLTVFTLLLAQTIAWII